MSKLPLILRDISWLSFNARILQEAADKSVALKDRIHFLAIHSSNLDEFFSIRVPALKGEMKLHKNQKDFHTAEIIKTELAKIHEIVIQQQNEFTKIWNQILLELNRKKIFIRNENELTAQQINFIRHFYDTEVSSNINPLFIESLASSKPPWIKNVFLGVVMRSNDNSKKERYAIIEIPTKVVNRFILLPSKKQQQEIILLEDVIRYHLPLIFSYFGYDHFDAHLFKVAQNAEIDIDNDISVAYTEKIARGVKERRKAEPIYLLYDKEMDPGLFNYLIRWLNITKEDSIIPRGRIRSFRDFLNFPAQLEDSKITHPPFTHPDLLKTSSVSKAILKKDVMIYTPYHSFNAVIDLLREAAMDPDVKSIDLTAYRLAKNSKICNALINAARNGKKVTVVIELKAHFDEEANLGWKNKLEEEGVKVYVGFPNIKIHAKMCLIKKVIDKKVLLYGFIGTGNLNEDTTHVYSDFYLLTSNNKIMADINKIFSALKKKKLSKKILKSCEVTCVSPFAMRKGLNAMIDREIRNKINGKSAGISLQLNSLSDENIINKLYKAAKVGVPVKLIIRGIMCALTNNKKFKMQMNAISIVDLFLEHGRAWVFNNNGANELYITSADIMYRNLNYRVEVAIPILDKNIKQQILDILDIKFNDNVKARILDNNQLNHYVNKEKLKIRSQVEIYKYLRGKKVKLGRKKHAFSSN